MRPVTIPAAVVPPTQADAPSAVITEPAEVPSTPPESPAQPKQTAPIATSGGKTPGADAVAGSQRAVVPAKPVAQAPVAATEKVAPPKPQPRSDAKPLDDKPTPARDPIAICAEASILTRTMCIYRECQKPEFYQLPVCVADRKHWEEQNKARN
ncbi:MAG: hypothetical protein EBR58_09945 [Betaproteobacteria bacterium]|nr:hypothetical protein [Betaproteobacteria bacterium]